MKCIHVDFIVQLLTSLLKPLVNVYSDCNTTVSHTQGTASLTYGTLLMSYCTTTNLADGKC